MGSTADPTTADELVTRANLNFAFRRPQASGFTLIELILVMSLLIIAVGLSFPALQDFFRGRGLDSEARRFLSLVRYGQSRAVSEGIPMLLWVDAREGTYG